MAPSALYGAHLCRRHCVQLSARINARLYHTLRAGGATRRVRGIISAYTIWDCAAAPSWAGDAPAAHTVRWGGLCFFSYLGGRPVSTGTNAYPTAQDDARTGLHRTWTRTHGGASIGRRVPAQHCGCDVPQLSIPRGMQ